MIRLTSRRLAQRLLLISIIALVALSPLLQGVGAEFFYDSQTILLGKSNPALRPLLAETSSQGNSQANVLLTFDEVPSSEQIQKLAELGSMESFTGHVASIRLPLSLLPKLATFDFVSHVYAPRRLTNQLDKSVPDILADQVWSTLRDPAGNPVNGTGVVVGIVDTGIDYTHRDFFFPNGTSKILYIWDQSVDGKAPNGFTYGNECSRDEIQTGTCSEIDGVTNDQEPGHGTSVAAVAASSGQAANLLTSCLRYNGTEWQADPQLCGDDSRTDPPFVLLASSSDYRYFGDLQKFSQLFFDVQNPGEYGSFTWEYSMGSGQWGQIKVESNQTSNLARSGTVYFTPPSDWAVDSVNKGANQYWVRVKADGVARPATITHVQANPPYKGVAPGAMIIAVKLLDGSDTSILEGVDYIVKKARELGLPLVISDSFADVLGSHDGSEPLELAFSDLASQGVPIVVVAGNERNIGVHVSGKLTPGQPVTVSWSNGQSQNHLVDLWYSVNDVVGISVRTPGGVTVTGPTTESGVNTLDGNVVIQPDERSTGKEWFINVTSTLFTGTPPEEIWSFNLTGITVNDGKWDAWTEPGHFLPNPASLEGFTALANLYKIDPSDTIDYPGNSRGVITVGGYMTKYYWRSGCTSCIDYTTSIGKRGVWWTVVGTGEGNITDFSGMGPTRDGRTKPEIVAPAANIATARAVNEPQKHSDPDNYHQIDRGTSVAAPHVAGVIALMLQMNHYLSPNEIKSILIQDARQDQFTGKIDTRVGSPLWGWGKVNALNSTRDAATLYAVRIEVAPIGRPLITHLTLDEQDVAQVQLNETRTIIFEFQRNGNHTVSLTPIIQADPGSRYVLTQNSWNFSSGGVARFQYKLQFFLQVTSPYGQPMGTGWYDQYSTAVASIYPTVADGHEFQGWTGSVNSSSERVSIVMGSGKQETAIWTPIPVSSSYVITLATISTGVVASLAAALIIRHKSKKHP